ncbi:hypothetical protein H9P43_010026 [Blastocladiella emersonii ATCC 22665]|nr:hypothetical protein H9P43_010026 [Blastocladiella emersonii ATCC 22665]
MSAGPPTNLDTAPAVPAPPDSAQVPVDDMHRLPAADFGLYDFAGHDSVIFQNTGLFDVQLASLVRPLEDTTYLHLLERMFEPNAGYSHETDERVATPEALLARASESFDLAADEQRRARPGYLSRLTSFALLACKKRVYDAARPLWLSVMGPEAPLFASKDSRPVPIQNGAPVAAAAAATAAEARTEAVWTFSNTHMHACFAATNAQLDRIIATLPPVTDLRATVTLATRAPPGPTARYAYFSPRQPHHTSMARAMPGAATGNVTMPVVVGDVVPVNGVYYWSYLVVPHGVVPGQHLADVLASTGVAAAARVDIHNTGIPAQARLVLLEDRPDLNLASWTPPNLAAPVTVVAESERSYVGYGLDAEIEGLRRLAWPVAVLLKYNPIAENTDVTIEPRDKLAAAAGDEEEEQKTGTAGGDKMDVDPTAPRQRTSIEKETGAAEIDAKDAAYLLRLGTRTAADYLVSSRRGKAKAKDRGTSSSAPSSTAASGRAPPAASASNPQARAAAGRNPSGKRDQFYKRRQALVKESVTCAEEIAKGNRPRTTPRIENHLLLNEMRDNGDPSYALVYKSNNKYYLYAAPGRPRGAMDQWVRKTVRTQTAYELELKHNNFPTFEVLTKALKGAPFLDMELIFGLC